MPRKPGSQATKPPVSLSSEEFLPAESWRLRGFYAVFVEESFTQDKLGHLEERKDLPLERSSIRHQFDHSVLHSPRERGTSEQRVYSFSSYNSPSYPSKCSPAH